MLQIVLVLECQISDVSSDRCRSYGASRSHLVDAGYEAQ